MVAVETYLLKTCRENVFTTGRKPPLLSRLILPEGTNFVS